MTAKFIDKWVDIFNKMSILYINVTLINYMDYDRDLYNQLRFIISKLITQNPFYTIEKEKRYN